MTSVFLSHRSDFTFLSAFPSSYLIFQFLAFDPNSRFKTQISSSKRFTSVKDKVPNMYRVSPKKALSECCWSHSALAQSPFAGTLVCLEIVFFVVSYCKTKQDQAPPSHVNGKIWPHLLNLGYDFVLIVHYFLGHTV